MLLRITLALACTGALSLSVGPSSAAQAVVETCQGRPATVVGPTNNAPLGPFGEMHGTSGDDVIVTNGAYAVSTGPGNDLICTTNSGEHVYLLPGTGNDVVDTTNDHPGTTTWTNLGSSEDDGVDSYIGGPGQDFIYLSDTVGPDLITAGSGNDALIVSCGAWTTGQFRANLGAGDDGFEVDSPDMPPQLYHLGPLPPSSCPTTPTKFDGIAFTLDGGSGRNHLAVLESAGQRVIGIDLTKGVVTSNHVKVGTVVGFADISAASRQLRVIGDEADNRITWIGCRGTARGVAGRDSLLHSSFGDYDCKPARSSPFRAFGGPGNDTLLGNRTDEILTGGPGHDRARAGKGQDVCRSSEVPTGCEVSR